MSRVQKIFTGFGELMHLIWAQSYAASLYRQENPIIMRVTAGATVFDITLHDHKITRKVMQTLPQTICLEKRGNQYQGKLVRPFNAETDILREVFETGEVAYWPSEHALCLFLGRIPARIQNERGPALPGVPLGRIAGDISALSELDDSLEEVTLSLKHAPFDSKNFTLPVFVAGMNIVARYCHL